MMASLLACGIDPERSTLFHQDMVSLLSARVVLFCLACADDFCWFGMTGTGTCGAGVDLELYHADGEAESDDDLEGQRLDHHPQVYLTTVADPRLTS